MRSSIETFFILLLTATLASAASALVEPTMNGAAGPRRGPAHGLAEVKDGKKAPVAKAPAQRPAEPLRVAEPATGAALPPVPRPTLLPRESEHIQRYDAAIAPLRNLAISEGDSALLREAIANGAGGKLAEARALRDRIGEPSARKLVDWFIFRAGYGVPRRLRPFSRPIRL